MKLFDILDFTVVDAIDILLFASLLYYLYRLIRGTVAINIFMGIVIIYLIWKITEALQMQLLSSILGQFIGVGVFALIVVFQQEIRRFLLTLGSTNITARNKLQRVFHFFKECYTFFSFFYIVYPQDVCPFHQGNSIDYCRSIQCIGGVGF